MGWRSSPDDGTGTAPGSGPTPSATPAPWATPAPPVTPVLPGFANGGRWDSCPPSAALAVALEAASGPEWRCPGGAPDELLGLLRQWQALESWAAAGKLGVLRALIRDDDQPLPGGGYRGDLPEGWTKSLTHEVALALSIPAVSAEKLMWLAWNLQAALPGTGDLLARGELTLAKARAVDTALGLLGDEDAARAEAMILPDLPGKTYGQLQQLAVQAAVTVDPESATRRREDAERHKSRVTMFREESGAAGLSGRDLPTDQTLAAHASVCARAGQYQDSGVFPDETRMDQYRVAAYLDLLNGISAEARIASGQLTTAETRPGDGEADPGFDDSGPDGSGPDAPGPDGPGSDGPGRPGPDDPAPDDPSSNGGDNPAPRLADLVLPLATLLGLAERPGTGHGLGPVDPDLCRKLAAAATRSLWTQLCVTVTDPAGIAIGHGCARPDRRGTHGTGMHAGTHGPGSPGQPGAVTVPVLPARLNLTVPADRLAALTRSEGDSAGTEEPPGQSPWSFARRDGPGPPGGFGTWNLTLSDGSNRVIKLEPVPVSDCDHRHESRAYQPNGLLRHLVQVRDYECTFPTCSRHARESDFEHAIPYDKGGRTCGCNAGARSRACHRVKQSPDWTVTQPRPGRHQWQTPSGRVYTQAPKRYPA
jgi:Domain of unknown function (DUF222)